MVPIGGATALQQQQQPDDGTQRLTDLSTAGRRRPGWGADLRRCGGYRVDPGVVLGERTSK